jgi:hypothetical protein
MTGVRVVYRATYYSPAKGRHYLTARACANAEAGALLAKKYPTEEEDTDWRTGQPISAGWHWSSDERLKRVHERLARRYRKKLRRLEC